MPRKQTKSEKCSTLLKHPWAVTVAAKQHLLATENLKEQFLATHRSAQSALLSSRRRSRPSLHLSAEHTQTANRPPLRLLGDRNVFFADGGFALLRAPPATETRETAETTAADRSEITAEMAAAEEEEENLFSLSTGEGNSRGGLSLNVMFCYFVVCRDHLAADSMRFVINWFFGLFRGFCSIFLFFEVSSLFFVFQSYIKF